MKVEGQKRELIDLRDRTKELDETAYWLELLAGSAVVPEARLANRRDECDQLLAIFTTISKKAKANSS